MCLHSLFCICMSHFPRTICWRDYFFSTILPLLLSNLHWLWVKVACSCLTFCNPMDCRPQAPLSMGILQARIQEEIAIPSSIGCFWPRDRTQVSCISGRFFSDWAVREAQRLMSEVLDCLDLSLLHTLLYTCVVYILYFTGFTSFTHLGWELEAKQYFRREKTFFFSWKLQRAPHK